MAETETIPAIDPQPAAEQPQYPKGYFTRITSANAREMAAKSAEARRERKIQRQEAAASPLGEPQNGGYVASRRACVREQLARVDEMILKEKDPQRLDRLASAQARLSEQERILDGRPLPGAFRPARPRVQPATGAEVL